MDFEARLSMVAIPGRIHMIYRDTKAEFAFSLRRKCGKWLKTILS